MTTSGDPFDSERTIALPARGAGAPASDAGTLAAGTRLGRYRIDSLLGRGGMGEVYLAEQLEPVRRTVALKLLRGRRLDARRLGHVEIEQQLLAQMHHPAIAQVYDAGATADGDPYFAMEYIEGCPVTRYCRERALPLRQRIGLFVRICEGVQHAHHKGVVHRDLKPANILVAEVDGRPSPRIIDFGIATAASRDGRGGADASRAGTPDYMSPEQADDPASVDTRSDVYSLGVLLYEILAGQRPGNPGDETVRTRATRVRPPSEALTASARDGAGAATPADAGRADAAATRRALRRDLDWVVLKAMCHDRDGRYASAAALADDLHRFLDERPLQAVPATRRYAWRKFARRHRIAIAAGSAIALALLAGLGLSLYGLMQAQQQRALAERRSAELEKVAAFQQSMLERIDVQAMGLALADGLREQVERADPGAVEGLETALTLASGADLARALIGDNVLARAQEAIDRDFAGQPDLAADLRESVGRVHDALGMYDRAAGNYADVAAYRADALGADAPGTLAARAALAGAWRQLSRYGEARGTLESALAAAQALPDGDEVRARVELGLAEVEAAQGELPQARARQQAVVARLREARGAEDGMTMDATHNLAISMSRMGDLAEARALMEALLPLRSRIDGPEHEDTLPVMGTLAALRAMMSDMEPAEALQRTLVEVQTRRLGREHPVTLAARGNLANMLSAMGRNAQALEEARAVHEAHVRVLGSEHPQTLRSLLNLAAFHARGDDFAAALPLEEQVIQARRRILGPRHPDTLFILLNHGVSLVRAGRPADALEILERSLPEAREVLGERHPQFRVGMLFSGQARMELGDAGAAAEILRDTLRLQRQHMGEDSPDTAWTAWMLVRALHADGRGGEADALQAGAIDPLVAADPETLGLALRSRREEILAQMETLPRPGVR